MKMSFRFKFIMTLSKLCKVALMLFIFGTANILADVCVWRNPERTMSTIFPEAKDYRTVDKKISPDKREIIEKKLNDKLAPGEREDWTYYKILGKDDQGLGCIIADAEKGEFGVIEIVMGITPDGKVKGVYIQRAREKKKEFKSKEFLSQFEGKTVKDSLALGKDIKVKEVSLPVKMTVLGIRKMLLFYEELANQDK